MFRTVLLWCIAMRCLVAEGQQLKLGNHPASINKASLLELESNNQGLLLPRIPDTTVSPLGAAPTGMLIFFNGDSSFRLRKGARWQTIGATNLSSSLSGYNVILNSSTGNGTSFALPRDSLSRLGDVSETALTGGQLLQYNGTAWTNVTPSYLSAGTAWLLNGNTATSANFLGTTNAVGLHIRTNNVERMYLDSVNGTVGIGTNQFTAAAPEKLLVNAGTTSSYNAIVARGSVNNYFQLNINNQNSSSGASSDIVATADNGNENTNFVDLGINSSNYNTSAITGGPDNAYLYSTANDFVIGNGSSGYNLIFFTGGTASTNEAMRINANGLVGIGTTAPATKLHVVGTNPLTLTGVQTGVVTDSVLTITGGLVRKMPSSTYIAGSGLTYGSVPFIGTNGLLRQNNAALFWDSTNNRLGIGTNTPASDLTIYQSAGATSKGFRFTGNSISGNNTGSGFAVSLGYNIPGNKQLWLGDADYMGNVNGTFIRYSSTAGQTILDAISGDNSIRRPTRIGVGNDANSSIILGDDGNTTLPGSYVWNSNNMAIGAGYRAIVAPTNGLLVQGNVGIGTTAPATALQVSAATNPLTLMGVQTGATTDSLLTITGGLVRKLPGTNYWSTAGNTATSANFLGTTNAVGLHIRTNNVERMYLDSVNGTVGIGTNQFTAAAPEKLLVNAGTTSSYNAIVARGSVNNYFQLNINNQNSSSGASSDIVATADNGNENTNYVDLGINSSNYNTSAITGGPDNAYLYSTANDFVIGNGSSGYNLIFFTGGTASTNEAMRINTNGRVGIANTNPAAVLDDGGTFKLGSKGTVLNNLIKGSYTTTAALGVGFGATSTLNVAIANAPLHATVTVSPEAALPGGTIIAYAYVSSAGTVTIAFSNVAALGGTIPTGTVFDITVIQ